MRRSLTVLLLVGWAANAATWAAQSAGVQETRLRQAEQARAAGRRNEALQLANQAPAAPPASRKAAALKIEVLTQTDGPAAALAAYEEFVGRTGGEDAGLLAPIARGELQVLGSQRANPRLRTDALERLARHGDSGARQKLAEMATGEQTLTVAALGADASLGRLGDARARARLAQLAEAPDLADKSAVITALRSASARELAYVLLPLLHDRNPMTRGEAAGALGALGLREAVAPLTPLLKEPDPFVRYSAAVALKRLGSDAADGLLAEMLKSPAPDVRLLAVQAYVDRTPSDWTKVARELLKDPHGLTRFQAAELLLKHDPAVARATLVAGLRDSNPATRAEALRILEAAAPYDLTTIRPLLRDPDPVVRLYAAGAVLNAGK